MHQIAVKMPAAEDHAPLSVLNRTGHGIRTMVVCSCEWMPAKAPAAASVMNNSHMAHRRKHGMPHADYSATVFGEGPWMGMTWDDWYDAHGSDNVDPYTGASRA